MCEIWINRQHFALYTGCTRVAFLRWVDMPLTHLHTKKGLRLHTYLTAHKPLMCSIRNNLPHQCHILHMLRVSSRILSLGGGGGGGGIVSPPSPLCVCREEHFLWNLPRPKNLATLKLYWSSPTCLRHICTQ